jgi:cytochrome c biogenesis protein
VLGASIALLTGLLGMLLLRRERVFARTAAGPDGGGTVLTLASLTRGGGDNGPRFAALTADLDAALAARTRAEPEVPPRDS